MIIQSFNSLPDCHLLELLMSMLTLILSFNSLPDSHWSFRFGIKWHKNTFNSLPDSHNIYCCWWRGAIKHFQFPTGFSLGLLAHITTPNKMSFNSLPDSHLLKTHELSFEYSTLFQFPTGFSPIHYGSSLFQDLLLSIPYRILTENRYPEMTDEEKRPFNSLPDSH